MKKIVFTGGGTLGHVMPNVYLMETLRKEFKSENDLAFCYIGSNGIEKEKLMEQMEYRIIPAIKLVRGKFFVNLKIPFVLIDSIFKAKKILKEIKPDVIFSKGGYVSLPVCVAGRMLKIPIIAHESDYSFGLANKMILKLCNTMCVNFENLANPKSEGQKQSNKKKANKIVYTGPIFSDEFMKKTKDSSGFNLEAGKKTLLILGGSLGSKKINEMIFPILKDLLKSYNIIHITGKGNTKIKSYANYNAIENSDNMANIYNLADFVLARSGAGVTAESFVKKLPMLLIPLENSATRGDQLLNAKYYEKLGVAQILHEKELTPTKLLKSIDEFFNATPNIISKYKTLTLPNGKDKVLELIKQYLK